MKFFYCCCNFKHILNGLDEQNQGTGSDTSSTISSDHSSVDATDDVTSCAKQTKSGQEVAKLTNEMTLLDLYSGCGAMSTGLCLGATLAGVKLTNVSEAISKTLNSFLFVF